MKKNIFTYIFSLAALLMFAPMLHADPTTEGIEVKKTVTQQPDENGVYWITLESFVTGAVTVKNESVPADIVLVLDVSTSMTESRYGSYTTRLAALRASVLDFIETIDKNDLYEDWEEETPQVRRKDADGNETRLGNRISIIPFGGSLATSGNLVPLDLTALSNKSTLTAKANNLTSTIKGTNPYNGLELAKDYLKAAVDAEKAGSRDVSTKTVVLFTDGCPASKGSTTFDAEIAYNAVRSANEIKTKEQYGKATVFTIGLFTDLGDNKTEVKNYMNYASSNFPTATATSYSTRTDPESVTYTPGEGTYDGKFFQMAGDDDLNSIFTAIAKESGGTSSDLTEESLVDVDVVSNSFALPSGALAENDNYKIKIFVAQCTGYDATTFKGNAFGDEIEVPNNGGANFADVLKSVYNTTTHSVEADHTDYNESISINVVGNEIETTGFNFGLNFCGRHSHKISDTEFEYYADGYKLIIKIPIVVNDDAVGGAGTRTNDPGSGIYVKDETQPTGRRLITKFPEPDVTIPVNIWIKKYGLHKGESAKFLVQRILVGNDVSVETNWQDYTTVLITGTGETETQEGGEVLVSPIAKLNGLSEKYHYRVLEVVNGKTWAWSYNSPDGPIATYQIEKNPMVFTNVKKDTPIHHAESKAINVFGVGKSAKTIDSREFFTTPSNGSSTGSDTGNN